MALYLYGLILARNADRLPRALRGLDGGEVFARAGDGAVAALVGTLARQPDRNRLDDVRAHDEVLQQVVQGGVTAAASRFGQRFPDEEALDVQLRDSAKRIETLLTRFDGAVEMRVLVPARAAPLPDESAATDDRAGPGRRYLEELRHASVPSRAGIAPALGGIVLAEKVEALPGGRGTAFAHLVRQDRLDDYRSAVRALAVTTEEHARVVGPLPLYSFAEPGVEA